MCRGPLWGHKGRYQEAVEFPVRTSSEHSSTAKPYSRRADFYACRGTVSGLFWFHEKGLGSSLLERRDMSCAIVAQTTLLFTCQGRRHLSEGLESAFPTQGPSRAIRDSLPDESPSLLQAFADTFCWAVLLAGKNTPSDPRREVAIVQDKWCQELRAPTRNCAEGRGPRTGGGLGPWGSLEGDRDAGHRASPHLDPGLPWVEGGGHWPRWWVPAAGRLMLDLRRIQGPAEECGL